MTYRDKLLAIAARLHDGPLSDQERVDMGKLIARHADRIGFIEECLDVQVEESRRTEIAAWEYPVGAMQ